MDYFKLAAGLARAEGAKTLHQVATKSIALKTLRNRGNACCCSAYVFPHRAGGGVCPSGHYDNQTQEEINAALLADFERNEANWINS